MTRNNAIFIHSTDLVRISGRGVASTGESAADVLPSGITSRARETATGSGGRIDVISRVLEVLDGGEISASTLGAGAGGDLVIHVSGRLVARGVRDYFQIVSRMENFGD